MSAVEKWGFGYVGRVRPVKEDSLTYCPSCQRLATHFLSFCVLCGGYVFLYEYWVCLGFYVC